LAGSIKGDVKKKHFFTFAESEVLLASSPWLQLPCTFSSGLRFYSAPAVHGWNFGVPVCAPTSNVLASCQPWFYRRLATGRGAMALLGCPREHMVAR